METTEPRDAAVIRLVEAVLWEAPPLELAELGLEDACLERVLGAWTRLWEGCAHRANRLYDEVVLLDEGLYAAARWRDPQAIDVLVRAGLVRAGLPAKVDSPLSRALGVGLAAVTTLAMGGPTATPLRDEKEVADA